MSAFNQILDKARAGQKRIVLPEATDERVLQAAAEVVQQQLAKPVLVGNPEQISAHAQSLDINLNNVELVDHLQSDKLEQYAAKLVELRKHRGMDIEKANEELKNAFVYACMMMANDDADGCVAGAITATAHVVRGAMQLVGKRDDVKQVSSFFIMRMLDQHPVKDVMVIADCALVIDPDAEELASIAADTGDSVIQLLSMEPEIAMLSFSTAGSAKHKHVRKVSEASALLSNLKPQWRVVGEVQLDAAVIPSILASKAPESASDSPCNTLIFPNLDAGNIGYKLIERFGGAQAIGPVLQGLNKPVNDLSRGCQLSDIVNLVAVTAAQC
jgi:phosphate acetyltransferase